MDAGEGGGEVRDGVWFGLWDDVLLEGDGWVEGFQVDSVDGRYSEAGIGDPLRFKGADSCW